MDDSSVDPALATLQSQANGNSSITSGTQNSAAAAAARSTHLTSNASFDALYGDWINPPEGHLAPQTQTGLSIAQLMQPGSAASTGAFGSGDPSINPHPIDADLLASILNSQNLPPSLAAPMPSARTHTGARGGADTGRANFLNGASAILPSSVFIESDAHYPPSSGMGLAAVNAPAAAAAAAAAAASKQRRSAQNPRQADDASTAADVLLRLALPSGPNTATTASSGDGQEGDEDASGEDDVTHVSKGKKSAVSNNSNNKNSSSAVPAEANGNSSTNATSSGAAAGATARAAPAGRRTSGRVRKTVHADPSALVDSDDDSGPDEYKDDEDELVSSEVDEEEDDDEDEYGAPRKSAKAKGKAKAAKKPESAVAPSSATKADRRTSTSSASRVTAGKRTNGDEVAPASGDASDAIVAPALKKPRTSGPPAPRRPRRVAAPVTVPFRTFPPEVEVDSVNFARLYRTFPISSAFPPDSYVHRLRTLPGAPGGDVVFMQPPPDAKWNKATDPFNLYAPRFVKGLGDDKCGLCPICAESEERGGEGVERWLKLKNSSFVYHMSYAHGLSNLTGLPFSPPVKLRTQQLHATTKDARDHMTEGLCHKCNEWIPMLSVKNVDAVVPELIWWKHAKPCHGTSSIQGEGDHYVLDEVYNLVIFRKSQGNGSSAGPGLPAAAGSSSLDSLEMDLAVAPSDVDPFHGLFDQHLNDANGPVASTSGSSYPPSFG